MKTIKRTRRPRRSAMPLLPAKFETAIAGMIMQAMAGEATTYHWSKLSIWVGDGDSPEDFTAQVCGLTAQRFGLTGATSDTEVPNCEDRTRPVWVERVIRTLSGGFSGSGVLAKEVWAFWRTWMLSGLAKNVRIVVDDDPNGYFEARFVLTQCELTGNLSDGKIQVSLAGSSDGAVVFVEGEAP